MEDRTPSGFWALAIILIVSVILAANGGIVVGPTGGGNIATTSAVGVVKPDGTTITIDGTGKISTVGGGSFTGNANQFGADGASAVVIKSGATITNLALAGTPTVAAAWGITAGGTGQSSVAAAAAVLGNQFITSLSLLPTTTPSYAGQIIAEDNGNGLWPIFMAENGGINNTWHSRFNISQSLGVGNWNGITESNRDGSFPLIVCANGWIGNQTNGLNNTVNAEGVIRMKNMAAGEGAAIYAEMGSNNVAFQSGYSTVDANAIQFGTVNQGGTEPFLSGTIGAVADNGYPWAFGILQQLSGESGAGQHEWFGFDYVQDEVWMPLFQPNIYSHTNASAIRAFAIKLKTGIATVYSNLLVGGTIFGNGAGVTNLGSAAMSFTNAVATSAATNYTILFGQTSVYNTIYTANNVWFQSISGVPGVATYVVYGTNDVLIPTNLAFIGATNWKSLQGTNWLFQGTNRTVVSFLNGKTTVGNTDLSNTVCCISGS